MRALITNDDGIDSPGLAALARGAVDHGWAVVVAAPAAEASGTSAGLTGAGKAGQVTVERRELPGLPDVPAFAVAAHPGLIALAAAQGTFGEPPEIVLSGVNHGANVGRAILHSGTVGAALTASINGARALAVSLDVGLEPGPRPHWDTAVAVAATLFDRLTELPAGTVLNLNVPDRAEAGPPKRTGLAEFGAVRSHVQNGEDGAFTVAAVTVEGELSPGSDARLLSEGHATVTALNSVSEDPDLAW
ncbi:5'/3'-nucleotidase SurE [Amycolatopsis regifaucium]|uniref:5'-nucleotidase n=1 Tax=Amycolatopsis regifaucium TaxID=546365 RepID=A0A154MQI0_9PSEU|nr:5'/3'-nucleotidase SurE [Amycolatopsis regifaucium]KZB86564.1 5'/3'-nucleotidase SurE [Amycolatopsis regifaucium]OKA03509.1 5'/3'-nucleotidase SurE [Amycolatopsis regifaucium]SFJ15917.1 5'-nucleotidase [Amycolatopsis regifaucium]